MRRQQARQQPHEQPHGQRTNDVDDHRAKGKGGFPKPPNGDRDSVPANGANGTAKADKQHLQHEMHPSESEYWSVLQ
ncbi:hypothetical protein GCM10011321_07540 [Youhaiella tibetensis]|nr:hypothetical protein GCM10011321_07540 [Youhaiella tibetensis]